MTELEPAQGEEKSEGMEMLYVNAGVGARTNKPFVSIRVKDQFITIAPDEARSFAMNLLECAEAAETDHFILSWVTAQIGANRNSGLTLLRQFRDFRSALREGGEGDARSLSDTERPQ